MEPPAQILAVSDPDRGGPPVGHTVTQLLTNRVSAAPNSPFTWTGRGTDMGRSPHLLRVHASSTHTCLLGPALEGCPLWGGWAAGSGRETSVQVAPFQISSPSCSELGLASTSLLSGSCQTEHPEPRFGVAQGAQGRRKQTRISWHKRFIDLTTGFCHMESTPPVLQRRLLGPQVHQ